MFSGLFRKTISEKLKKYSIHKVYSEINHDAQLTTI